MRTTVEIPDDLFRKAKAHAALKGIMLKDLVVSALRKELARSNPPRKGYRVRFPLIPMSETGVITAEQVDSTLIERR